MSVVNLICSECGKDFSNQYNLRAHFEEAYHGKTMKQSPKTALVKNKGRVWYEMQDYEIY